jgi:hypothetical protein
MNIMKEDQVGITFHEENKSKKVQNVGDLQIKYLTVLVYYSNMTWMDVPVRIALAPY